MVIVTIHHVTIDCESFLEGSLNIALLNYIEAHSEIKLR